MSRTAGEWKLPQPTDIKEENEWISIPRIARTVPFGYKLDENERKVLIIFLQSLAGILQGTGDNVIDPSDRDIMISFGEEEEAEEAEGGA